MDDYYERFTQVEPHYSSYAFTYTLDENYTVNHTTSYTRDL